MGLGVVSLTPPAMKMDPSLKRAVAGYHLSIHQLGSAPNPVACDSPLGNHFYLVWVFLNLTFSVVAWGEQANALQTISGEVTVTLIWITTK